MRYKVVEESVLGHGCCHKASVIDSTKVENFDSEGLVCECLDVETAQQICDLLNAKPQIKGEGEENGD